MNRLKRSLLLLLTLALVLGLSSCTIPSRGFADYDVSGYIQALLDSSYHSENAELMAIAAITEEQARQYNDTTVENAAATFCNTYKLSPSEEQLAEFQVIMRQAFALTKYTVRDERKVETGYYLEVEVASITNFSGREADIERLKEQARQEATAANTPMVPSALESSEADDWDDGEDSSWGDGGDSEASSSFPEESSSAPEAGDGLVDANALFIDKVLEFCKQELANISYDAETRTLPLDIRQTDQGELQLDLNQIDKIDRTVVRFED